MPTHLDEAGIRRYLLGLLPEPEAEAVEAEYFASPEALERVRGVEDDLLDDYAAGRLGAGEAQAFERRYFATPALRQRVMVARALRLAQGAPSSVAVRRLAVRRLRRWQGPLAIAAGLVVAVVVSWLFRPDARQPTVASIPPASVAGAETPAPGPTPTASPPSVASPGPPAVRRLVFALSPVLLRSQGGPKDLRVPPRTDAVVLELEGDPAAVPAGGARLSVVIDTVEGRRVWSGQIRRLGNADRPSVLASVPVPAARLGPGDYLLTLSAGDQTLYRYFFRVRRR